MTKISPEFLSMKFFMLILFASVLSFSAHSEIYKWTNEKGEVIYSERKPADKSATVSKITPRVRTSASPSLSKEPADEATAGAEPVVEERTMEDPKQKKLDEEIRKKNCEMANARYTSLQRPRVKELYADGSRREMGEDERQKEIQEASAAKAEWCQ